MSSPSTQLRAGRQERLSIIVPVYNEARTVRAVIDRLLTIELPVPREILVVDDGSTDGTGDVLDRAAGEGLAVTVIRMPQMQRCFLSWFRAMTTCGMPCAMHCHH